jgi:hypothetical protein
VVLHKFKWVLGGFKIPNPNHPIDDHICCYSWRYWAVDVVIYFIFNSQVVSCPIEACGGKIKGLHGITILLCYKCYSGTSACSWVRSWSRWRPGTPDPTGELGPDPPLSLFTSSYNWSFGHISWAIIKWLGKIINLDKNYFLGLCLLSVWPILPDPFGTGGWVNNCRTTVNVKYNKDTHFHQENAGWFVGGIPLSQWLCTSVKLHPSSRMQTLIVLISAVNTSLPDDISVIQMRVDILFMNESKIMDFDACIGLSICTTLLI